MWMGGGEQGSSAPSLTGISSQFRYNALRFKQAGFPSDDGKTFWRSFPRFGIVERKNRGNEGGGDPRIFLDAKSRLVSIYVVPSTRGSLSIFTSRCINVSGRNYTPVEGAFINTLGNYYWPPPAFAPSQGNARVINFVINHRELRVFVHVLLHVDALDVFVPCYLLFEWRESVIESVNFTAISDSQYRRSHLPSLPFVRLSPLRFFDVCFKYGRTYVIVERIVVMERGIESRLKFYFRLRIIALRNCWMSIEFLNGIPSTCSYIYYVHRWMSLKTTSFKF